MRIFNLYLLILSVIASLVNVLLAFLGQTDLGAYLIFNVIAYLVTTLIFIYLNREARKALSGIGIALFGIFLVILTLNIAKIIQGG